MWELDCEKEENVELLKSVFLEKGIVYARCCWSSQLTGLDIILIDMFKLQLGGCALTANNTG